MPFCFGWRSSPFCCCFDSFVSGVCASLSLLCPVRPVSGRDKACLPLDVVVVARPRVVPGFEFWRSGDLFWSPVRSALRQVRSSRSSWESFEVVQAGFLPTYCWLLLNWRHLSVFWPASAGGRSPLWPSGWRRRSSAAADRSRPGMGGRLSSPPS